MDLATLAHLAIALGLGFLVGLERERAGSPVAGIRTFPLITLLGTLASTVAPRVGGWIVPAAMLAVAVLVGIGAWGEMTAAQHRDQTAIGVTTEVAGLVMFAVGAALGAGFVTESIVIAGVVAVLLHQRQPLHALARRIGDDEAHAMFRFVLIALVILPVLPDRAFDRYQVLNPYQIWLMVVLIVGISLAAYVASRLLGRRGGLLATGVMGGLISSTATTVSHARASKRGEVGADAAAFVIVAASTVVFARVLAEIAVVSPALFAVTAPPMGVVMLWMAALAAVAFRFAARGEGLRSEGGPPSDLKAAITFGALYAVILFAVAFTKQRFGDRALFVVAGVSGLTDVDAITLSTAQLVNAERLEATVGWRLILSGTLSNLVFKGAAVLVLGDRRLRLLIASLFGLALAGAGLVLWLWPG
jgi:uncharacterized membrane protein (DUF4010 family)